MQITMEGSLAVRRLRRSDDEAGPVGDGGPAAEARARPVPDDGRDVGGAHQDLVRRPQGPEPRRG